MVSQCVQFQPEIPLGSTIVEATVGMKNIAAKPDQHEQDEHAIIEFDVGDGTTNVTIRYDGGVGVVVPVRTPAPGDLSTSMKVVSVAMTGNKLRMLVDATDEEKNTFRVRTARKITTVSAAKVERVAADD